eukprot:CAMPEP_0183532874 /NCGR_PEP_ID=MMETSP0371-20130417/25822_1 /TAXON_ID=268820 /ORGANISM="Peridinium aciculiferum, Strain PAER-2" /LENGTH=147 /DNA_ID=CAMNT_0025733065 /DNA_START=23 /DNA_END=466 /DNA_ORIENTATION=+
MGVAAFFTNKGGLKYADAADLKLLVIGLAAYIYLLHVFCFRQGLGRNLLNPKLVNSEDPVCKKHFANLDRPWLNSLEQAPLFLSAAILYSGLVNAQLGGILTLVYVAFTAIYPAVFGKIPLIAISTMPRYWIIQYMVAAVVLAGLRT